MEVIKTVVVAAGFILLFGLILYFLAELACYATKGKILGRVFHKINKWHWPDKYGPITIYRSGSKMSYCRYCNKRIVSVGHDWFTLMSDKE